MENYDYMRTVMDRCIVMADFECFAYRRFFKWNFMEYMKESGFGLKEIERLSPDDLDEMWLMFSNDCPEVMKGGW